MGKKKEKKKNFYDSAYFDLLDALKEEACPICLLIRNFEHQYMGTLFYELVNDPGVREKLRKSYGFCSEHAQMAKKIGNPLGIAIIYEDICSTLGEFTRKHDYRFSHEGFGGESASWKKVVGKVVGNKDEAG